MKRARLNKDKIQEEKKLGHWKIHQGTAYKNIQQNEKYVESENVYKDLSANAKTQIMEVK